MFMWSNGKIYQGQWENGKQHGKGEIIYPDGRKKKGIWINGKRVTWIKEEN